MVKATRDLEPRGRTARLLHRRAASEHPSRRAGDVHLWDHHRNVQSGGARAAVFGVSDGLVTNVSLILGFAGANAPPSVVRLAGIALLVAGAFSMASGEWTSMSARARSSSNGSWPWSVTRSATALKESGVSWWASTSGAAWTPRWRATLADEMMRTPELALETHAREELGINPGALGRPLQAALSSFLTFGVGALVPLLPWFVTRGRAAMLASVVLGVVAAIAVGAALAAFTQRSWLRSSFRQLLMTALPAAVTYGVGALIGIGVH